MAHPTPLGEDIYEYGVVTLCKLLPSVFLDGCGDLCSVPRKIECSIQGAGELRRIAWGHQQAVTVIADQLRNATHPAGYDGTAAREGLDDDIRRSFIAARQAEQSRGIQPVCDSLLRHLPGEVHGTLHLRTGRSTLQLAA